MLVLRNAGELVDVYLQPMSVFSFFIHVGLVTDHRFTFTITTGTVQTRTKG